MAKSRNRITNPDFARRGPAPRGWIPIEGPADIRRTKPSPRAGRRPDEPGATAGVTIRSGVSDGHSGWYQDFVVRPGHWYRVEAEVSCDLVEPVTKRESGSPQPAGGLSLAVAPVKDAVPIAVPRRVPPIRAAPIPVVLRGYYCVPAGVRRLRVSVQVTGARGVARVHHVRAFEILEPEAESHVLAVPPPPHAPRLPRRVQRVCIWSRTVADRPLTERLRFVLGSRSVVLADGDWGDVHNRREDALFFPDVDPPRGVRSIQRLIELAEEHLVFVSLSAFARLSRGRALVRTVEQEDDPIHARVAYANYATTGFALHDAFPFAAAGRKPWSFAQNQLRRTDELRVLLKQHGLVVMLESLCQRDATSYQPVCLFHGNERGALFVIDFEPFEATGSTLGEPTPSLQFLASALGHTDVGLGQYVVPARSEAELHNQVRCLADRFPTLRLDERYDAAGRVLAQRIIAGGTFDSPRAHANTKPTILIRAGLVPCDTESLYGTFLWFKQLARAKPHECSYAAALTTRFRLVWVLPATGWPLCEGWERPSAQGGQASVPAFEPGPLAAVIDVVSSPDERVRIVVPEATGRYARYFRWMPRLHGAFSTWAGERRSAPWLNDFADRDPPRMNRPAPEWEVVANADGFASLGHATMMGGGADLVRIEIPGCSADFATHSIARTGLVAVLLEHVVGLQYGLIAVNRRRTTVSFDAFGPLESGAALVVADDDPQLRRAETHVG